MGETGPPDLASRRPDDPKTDVPLAGGLLSPELRSQEALT
jgi:hypothetical protein